jgi:hypothetical protein
VQDGRLLVKLCRLFMEPVAACMDVSRVHLESGSLPPSLACRRRRCAASSTPERLPAARLGTGRASLRIDAEKLEAWLWSVPEGPA